MTTLSAEVAEAVRLRDAADNGPWLHKNAGPYDNGMTAGGLPGVWSSLWPTTDTPSICSVHYKENAALIAAAPQLVDLIERLHARVRELEDAYTETSAALTLEQDRNEGLTARFGAMTNKASYYETVLNTIASNEDEPSSAELARGALVSDGEIEAVFNESP